MNAFCCCNSMFLTEYTDINSNLNIDNMPLIISTSAISDLLTSPCKSYDNKFMAMIDSGANVAIASIDLVLALGVKMRPHDDSRRIGTANKNSELIIIGWIFENMDVYTGRIAIVENKLSYVLLSASAMQDHGMSTNFPFNQSVCNLDNVNGRFATITRNSTNHLYFIDIRRLLMTSIVPFIPQVKNTEVSVNTLLGGAAGVINIRQADVRVPDTKNESRKVSDAIKTQVWNLHKRLLHSNMLTVAADIESGRILNSPVTAKDIRLTVSKQQCLACAMSKWNRLPKRVATGVRQLRIGHTWSIDYIGPYAVVANGGFTGEFLCHEASCGYLVDHLVKSKMEATRVVKEFSLLCRRFGHRMEVVRVDFGSVENGSDFLKVCSNLHSLEGVHVDVEFIESGVEVRPAAPERQQQNPVERAIQTWKNLRAANMFDQNLLGSSFWGWCGIATAKGMNCISNTLCPDSNPLAVFERKTVDLDNMCKHYWGEGVISTKLGKRQLNLDPKNEFGVVVCDGSPLNGTSLVHFPSMGTKRVSPRYHLRPINLGAQRQLTVEETRQYVPSVDDLGRIVLKSRGDTNILGAQGATSPETEESSANMNFKDGSLLTSSFNSSTIADEVFSELAHQHRTLSTESHSIGSDEVGNNLIVANPPDPTPSAAITTRSSSRCNKGTTSRYQEFVGESSIVQQLMTCVLISTDEFNRRNPKWNKAKQGENKAEWLEADANEWKQQFDPEHTTLEEVIGGLDAIPRGTKVYPIKRVCKIKDDGTYKLRYCVLGNLDDYGGDTFAPTICKKLVWLLFAVSVLLGLYTQFFDIKGAFMSARPTRDIYVILDGKVYRLLYSLYGLKDAAKVFNDELVEHLINGGYVQSKWDQCFFIKWTSISSFIYIIVHVDDFKASASQQSLIDEFGDHLKQKYGITTNTDGMFLGVRIEKQLDGSTVFTKPFMLQTLFDKFLPAGPFLTIPMDPMSEKYSKDFDLDDTLFEDVSLFKSAMGMLVQHVDYRVDIAFTVSKIGHQSASPRTKDMTAVIYLIHYLYGTRDLGLRLKSGDRGAAKIVVQLRAYADYSHACHSNGRGQYSVCFDLIDASIEPAIDSIRRIYQTGMFYAKTWMAPTVDLCTAEGECGAIVEAVKDCILLNGCLEEMHQTQLQPTPLYNDNKSSILLATKYSGNHKRVRYMLPRINWLMEKFKERIYTLLYMDSGILPADFASKRHSGTVFKEGRNRVMGHGA